MLRRRTAGPVFLASWRFLTLLLAALHMTMGSAHVLELPAKMKYDGEMYMAVNSTLYPMFAAIGGVYTVASILSAAALTLLVRRRPSFGLTLAGTCCLALAFGLWLALVAPVNAEWSRVIGSDAAPATFLQQRARWEYSHVAGFSAALAGFSLLLAGVLVETVPRDARRS